MCPFYKNLVAIDSKKINMNICSSIQILLMLGFLINSIYEIKSIVFLNTSAANAKKLSKVSGL